MRKLGCDYTGNDFGARYIDSCCIDGFLWDLDSGDSDSLSIGGDIPCPECNHEEWIESQVKDDIEEKGYVAFYDEKSEDDCPFVEGCKLRYPDDWKVYREFWLKGFSDAKKEGEGV